MAIESIQRLEDCKRALADAQETNRLKDEFLATISHELRTPLTAIIGWVRMARAGKLDPEQLQDALEIIDRNASVQCRLIEDMLDTSRMITGKIAIEFQVMEPRPIVNAAVESIRPTATAKGVHLETSLQSTPPIYGNSARLQQILWNLLTNAVKFTPKGGKVAVILDKAEEELTITISDTGIGIKPEFLPHIFERFRQADSTSTRKHGGLGLGLAIVRHLVELHGGTVAVQSRGEGHGSTFVVMLPCCANSGETVEPAQDTSKSLTRVQPLRDIDVLVVEDEDDTRRLVCEVLKTAGARVIATASAAQAWTAFQESRPDVLVTDIGMPEEDGYTLIEWVRAYDQRHACETPAMALTAFATSADRLTVLARGFQIHMPKPFEPNELIDAVAGLSIGRYSRAR